MSTPSWSSFRSTGVNAYSVARRTAEIGVRMALGADRVKVVGLMLSGSFRIVAIGLARGVPPAIGAGRLILPQLYVVSGIDPMALASLGLSALAASLVPALRAAGLDPMRALRTE
jgi:ABC-type antimicrobial peptide transport system permease subunit